MVKAAGRAGQLTARGRRRLLRVLDGVFARLPGRMPGRVRAELEEIRASRREGRCRDRGRAP